MRTRADRRRRARRRAGRGASGPTMFFLLMGSIILLGLIAVLLSRAPAVDGGQQTAPVSIDGIGLPPEDGGRPDPAVGMRASELLGEDFDGGRIEIGADGRPKAIVFLAHWCSHCQREVADMSGWLARAELPIDVYSVATLTDPNRPNYPPSSWLEAEAWPAPVLVDDARSGAADAFGLVSTPLWVFLDGDGMVAARHSGVLGRTDLEAVAAMLASNG